MGSLLKFGMGYSEARATCKRTRIIENNTVKKKANVNNSLGSRAAFRYDSRFDYLHISHVQVGKMEKICMFWSTLLNTFLQYGQWTITVVCN